jgi:uncharacterized protein (UPF0548 family)
MLSLRKPTADSIRRFLAAQAKLDFTYSAVGATAEQPPAGFVVDHTRIALGNGEGAFLAARAGLQQWQQLRLGWLLTWPPESPIREGEVFAVVAHAIGLWWLNACRIAYIVDESGPISRFGLAYGTLPDHAAIGEERFLVEWDRAEDSVWFDILAFSRPNHILTKLGYPLLRRKQKRFGRESTAAMRQIVSSGGVSDGLLLGKSTNRGSGE